MHHIWGETVLFIIQTSERMQYFTIFQDKLHSVNIQDDQSWAFSETVQKISKITYTASRFSFLTSAKLAVRVVLSVWMNINRVTLQHNKEHNKEFIMFIVLFNGFITFDTRGILSPPASDVHERLKTNGTAIKFAKEPDVCLFQRWTQNKKIAQSFLSTAKFITKYPSKRFLSICGEKIYLKAF